jgi:hypothetical protein
MQKKFVIKNKFFAGILKVNDKNSRIRIQDQDPFEAWICGFGSGTTPKCHGSTTLLFTFERKFAS